MVRGKTDTRMLSQSFTMKMKFLSTRRHAAGSKLSTVAREDHRVGLDRNADTPTSTTARVLLVCPYAWDAPGGVQVHVSDLARFLRGRGHEVLIMAPAARAASAPGVRIVGRTLRFIYRGTIAPIAPWPWEAAKVRRVVRGFAPDVVHVHEPLMPGTGMWAVHAASARGLPVVATFHAFVENSPWLAWFAPMLRWVWRRIDVPVAVSRAAASHVSGPFQPPPRIVPNGVNVAAFVSAEPVPSKPAGRVMLWVNRLDQQKGFAVAVEAFAELAREFKDLTFVVAGDGPERDLVKRLPAPASDRVLLLGRVPHDKVPAWYAAADVYISPAVGQESFGIVLIEAMAAGTPVVASNIQGYREVLTGGGTLVPPGDAKALAKAVAVYLNDPAAAAATAEEGRRLAETYDWSQVGARIEAVYKEAAQRRAAR